MTKSLLVIVRAVTGASQVGTVDGFDVMVRSDGETTIVALREEFDSASVPVLHGEMAAARASAPCDVVIDARDLTFVGVRGLRALVTETQALRHDRRRVRTVNLRPPVRRVARALGVESLLGTACARH